ncbi:acyl-CoA thioesterase [Paludifilum halophilum]|uniref:4-hydroxybenzoyl-CoA thioesterase n=1 Tax=Paludifilum halophilum TaxID=1642702 RepID=A0A235B847_9BACL|nr:thioesterase family protein [Paludifilum halophilum]OYD08402.1 4-hydroxybenzoyl-CoA thioesterase [Paludifilum halophilum]
MKEPVFETTMRVRYQETDQMGVVHHSNYAIWFEVGRTDFIRRLGASYKDLEQRGILLPVVDLTCRFVAPARYDDEVRIATRISEARGPKLVFRYEVRRAEDGGVLARGTTTHLWVDRHMKRINLKRSAPDIFEIISRGFPASRGG